MKETILFLAICALLIFVVVSALANEEHEEALPSEDITEILAQDEEVLAQDLETGEPKILPDHPLYPVKNWWRGLRTFFTFAPVKKVELKLKFSNEKLIELKKLVEIKKRPRVLQKGVENYKAELNKMKIEAEKIKERAAESPQLDKFLDKFTQHQILHQRILQKLETQVPPEVFEKIKEAREKHLERFGEVMIKLEEKDKIPERLEKNLEEIKGSQYKHFKNLEVLMELEEKVPEQAREAIQKAQENALKRLHGDLTKMSPEDQEKFKEYLENITGDKERHLMILEGLRLRETQIPKAQRVLELQKHLEEAEGKVLEKIEQKLERIDCPLWVAPHPGFCPEGMVVVEKSLEGCPLPPKCILMPVVQKPPAPEVECPTLWSPVCGKNNKTYQNSCHAKIAGIEINYEGVCKEEPSLYRPVCIQVITPARDPKTGSCKVFATPCDVPEGWEKVDHCPGPESSISPEIQQ